MTDGTAERVRPRDRIVVTARTCFTSTGIKGVGVDAIAEAAGTNKMTLYRHFELQGRSHHRMPARRRREAEAMWDAI